ncbi:head GIN domain-containing protein [Devosia sp. Root635]|uniref:head GIN domain-containing protein n=1 Tax=Devosia sp. Root635 TaxID=1736575 RepID=UPI0006FC62EE|nr:head GIN domain-containing protein [Devosia sp. Root635]KRA45593.1 hypothetical protein ASD80_04495 [Devosia sp. Root635]
MRTAITLALGTILGLTLAGTAHAESRSFELSGFDKVDIAAGLDAVIRQGDFAVSATSNNLDALDNLQLSVVDGVLRARLDESFLDFIFSGGLVGMLINDNTLTIDITLPALTGLEASAGADVRAEGITSDQLDVTASSGANISLPDARLGTVRAGSSSGADLTLSGTADSISAEASSGADLDAADLVAATAKAEASSGADVSVHATARLAVNASSGGDVNVHGNPAERDVDTSSGGDVHFED